MTEIARLVVDRTTKNFPVILVGTGVIATIVWTCIVTVLAVDQVWSMLAAV